VLLFLLISFIPIVADDVRLDCFYYRDSANCATTPERYTRFVELGTCASDSTVGEVFFCRDGILQVEEFNALQCTGDIITTKDAMLCRSSQYQILFEFFESVSSCLLANPSICESDTVDSCRCSFGSGFQNGQCIEGSETSSEALAICDLCFPWKEQLISSCDLQINQQGFYYCTSSCRTFLENMDSETSSQCTTSQIVSPSLILTLQSQCGLSDCEGLIQTFTAGSCQAVFSAILTNSPYEGTCTDSCGYFIDNYFTQFLTCQDQISPDVQSAFPFMLAACGRNYDDYTTTSLTPVCVSHDQCSSDHFCTNTRQCLSCTYCATTIPITVHPAKCTLCFDADVCSEISGWDWQGQLYHIEDCAVEIEEYCTVSATQFQQVACLQQHLSYSVFPINHCCETQIIATYPHYIYILSNVYSDLTQSYVLVDPSLWQNQRPTYESQNSTAHFALWYQQSSYYWLISRYGDLGKRFPGLLAYAVGTAAQRPDEINSRWLVTNGIDLLSEDIQIFTLRRDWLLAQQEQTTNLFEV